MSGAELFAKQCAESLDAVTALANELTANNDVSEHVRILSALRDHNADMRQLFRDLEAKIGDEIIDLPDKKLVVDGLGEVGAGWTSDSYEWDMAGFVGEVVAKAMDEREMVCDEDGNKLPVNVLGHNVAKRIMECASVSYGRIKVAKAHGVDGYKYRTRNSGGRRTVRLPGRSAT